MRPKSIVQFVWVYAAIIVLGLVTTALSWDDMLASVQVQRINAQVGMGYVYVTAVIGIAIQLALWVFIGRRRSVIAKWIFVLITAIGLAVAIWGFATQPANPDAQHNTLIGVIGVATIVLDLIAIILLFRPDTRAWFGETGVAA